MQNNRGGWNKKGGQIFYSKQINKLAKRGQKWCQTGFKTYKSVPNKQRAEKILNISIKGVAEINVLTETFQ